MKRHLAIASIAVVAVAVSLAPAVAKSKHHRAHHFAHYYQPYAYGPQRPFVTRDVSDPSFGNRAGLNYARHTGRCVEDLGYGRFEYCGW